MAVASLPFLPQHFPHSSSCSLKDLPPQQQMAIAQTLAEPGNAPSHWVAPESQQELQSLLRQCHQNNWPIIPCGNQSKLTWGGLAKPVQLLVSSGRLNGIVDHAVADLTVTVEAGVKLKDLQAILQSHQQFLPLNPLYHDQATVGGIMATGCAGPWQQRYGGVRDLVLGFSFVRWDGQLAKAGGRVVKNVAGYDLMKLFIGSYGTLGFISQITFRLYPLPSHSQTVFLTGNTARLIEFSQALRRSGLAPTAALICSQGLVRALNLGEELGLLIRFQNLQPVVQAQVSEVEKLAQALTLENQAFENQGEIELWQRWEKTMAGQNMMESILCKFGLVPAQAVDFLQQLPGLGYVQLGNGIGWGRFGQLDREELSQHRQICQNYGGYLTVLGAAPEYKKHCDIWGQSGHGLAMMGRLKNQFDPHNLFSPGRFVGGF
ncbi:FAD-binding oxidoreductase [Synechocystis sp. PCC 7339]|uniref:FAD-binding oxidoreductase n=1 Tax=unclassified Synechocystis TaxID=2640012 RepID=UPI001BB0C1E7|nr:MULTISPECIES: FAD-binding oxidoreductase [unclassified Synechocystis]QUS61602.1 FAD-binding oxidoreductase [Synechocystis sp. PCC 7338]UAJ73800.1 FAD-binding oxidoreductase [Synechocystis sp. PCC 7339]